MPSEQQDVLMHQSCHNYSQGDRHLGHVFEDCGVRSVEWDYSGGGLSALRVTSSPPKLGGVRGGLNKRYNYRGLLHWPFFRPPRPSGSPPNLGGEEVTLSETQNSWPRVRSMSIEISIYMFSPLLVWWRCAQQSVPVTTLPVTTSDHKNFMWWYM